MLEITGHGNRLAYIDACVVIAWLNNERKPQEDLDGMTYAFGEASKMKLVLASSTLVFAECRKYPKELDKLFDHKRAIPYQLTIPIAKYAGEIGDKHGLKPADAIHVSTAVMIGCQHFASFDQPLVNRINSAGLAIYAGPPRILMPAYQQPKLEL